MLNSCLPYILSCSLVGTDHLRAPIDGRIAKEEEAEGILFVTLRTTAKRPDLPLTTQ